MRKSSKHSGDRIQSRKYAFNQKGKTGREIGSWKKLREQMGVKK